MTWPPFGLQKVCFSDICSLGDNIACRPDLPQMHHSHSLSTLCSDAANLTCDCTREYLLQSPDGCRIGVWLRLPDLLPVHECEHQIDNLSTLPCILCTHQNRDFNTSQSSQLDTLQGKSASRSLWHTEQT